MSKSNPLVAYRIRKGKRVATYRIVHIPAWGLFDLPSPEQYEVITKSRRITKPRARLVDAWEVEGS